MTDQPPEDRDTPPNPTLAQIQDCTRILEAIVGNPGVLATVEETVRIALLAAAGRVARPLPAERARLAKGVQRFRREKIRKNDREAVKQTGIRVARTGP